MESEGSLPEPSSPHYPQAAEPRPRPNIAFLLYPF